MPGDTLVKSRSPQGEAGRRGGPGETQAELSPGSPREQGLFETAALNSFAKAHQQVGLPPDARETAIGPSVIVTLSLG